MLAFKKGEYISPLRYFNVIYITNILIVILLVNNCIQFGLASETGTEFVPNHIETSCIEKCPDQVSFYTKFLAN